MNKNKFFKNEFGGMLLEILLSLAIAASILPFVMRELNDRAKRAENVRIARDIDITKDALERYMIAHKIKLFEPTGRVITKVKIRDLAKYGNIPKDHDKFQARIIKSRDMAGHSVLSGMVIYNSADISPLRTREIAELGGVSSGFIDKNHAHGAFGTWRSRTNIFDAQLGKNSIVGGTKTLLSGGDFLWRTPSKNSFDSSMSSNLLMGGNNINNILSIDARNSDFTEILKSDSIVAQKVQISPRTELDTQLKITGETLVMGTLTSDSRNAEISGELLLGDTGRFSRLEANELWVRDLNLNWLSVNGSDKSATLKISNIMDVTRGRVTARTVTVGYTGSVAPKINITERIEDPADSSYYWDLQTDVAHLSDILCGVLNPLLKSAINKESKTIKTETETIIRSVAANNNATISDYTKAINEIKNRVTQKYNNLNLE
ncbi:MAG: type II secretion system protein [Alphaproteobacteria bacterium]|jgi:hypothetical protein|nr:hypothetical protein [Alphaproteobacteria bacterium]